MLPTQCQLDPAVPITPCSLNPLVPPQVGDVFRRSLPRLAAYYEGDPSTAMVHIPLLHDLFVNANKLFYQAQASFWRPNLRRYSPSDPIFSDDDEGPISLFAEEASSIGLAGLLRPATPVVVPVSPHPSDFDSGDDTDASDVSIHPCLLALAAALAPLLDSSILLLLSCTTDAERASIVQN